MSRRFGGAMTLVTLGALGATSGCQNKGSKDQHNVIELGLLVEYDDPADTEEDISKANMAATEINDGGGISIDGTDYLVRIIAEDHEGSAAGGIKALERLAARGVTAVVGPPWSSIALGDAPDGSDGAAIAARDLGILMVSPSATSPAITDLDDDDLMWRTAPSDSLQAVLAADYLLLEKGVSRAGLLIRNEAWGRGLADAFQTAFEAGGGEIVGLASYDVSGTEISDLGTYDYQKELDAVFADSPEVILLANFDEVFQISNRIVRGGYLDPYGDTPPLFFGADATFTNDLLGNGAPEVLRRMEGVALAPDSESAAFSTLVANLEALDLAETDTFDAARYDAVYCVCLAMQAAQSIDAEEIKQSMRAVANAHEGDIEVTVDEWPQARAALLSGEGINYEGAGGPIEFDDAGDPTTGFFVLWKVVESSPGAFDYDLSNEVRFPLE